MSCNVFVCVCVLGVYDDMKQLCELRLQQLESIYRTPCQTVLDQFFKTKQCNNNTQQHTTQHNT